jgi:hypothetical protein
LNSYGSLKLQVSFHSILQLHEDEDQEQKQEFHFLLSLAYTEQYEGTNLKSTFKIEFFVLLHINYKVLSTHICGTGCDE